MYREDGEISMTVIVVENEHTQNVMSIHQWVTLYLINPFKWI